MKIPSNIKKIVFEKTPIDKIIDYYKTMQFIEVTGRAGGDVLTYRIYNDGSVCER